MRAGTERTARRFAYRTALGEIRQGPGGFYTVTKTVRLAARNCAAIYYQEEGSEDLHPLPTTDCANIPMVTAQLFPEDAGPN